METKINSDIGKKNNKGGIMTMLSYEDRAKQLKLLLAEMKSLQDIPQLQIKEKDLVLILYDKSRPILPWVILQYSPTCLNPYMSGFGFCSSYKTKDEAIRIIENEDIFKNAVIFVQRKEE